MTAPTPADRYVRQVRRVARANPDHAHALGEPLRARYQPTDANPRGCLLGATARSLGRTLDHHDQTPIRELFAGAVPWLAHATPWQQQWLQRVQTLQDEGHPWADAVTTADAELLERPDRTAA